jgi:hypothetical protein
MGYFTAYDIEIYEIKDGTRIEKADRMTAVAAIAQLRDADENARYAFEEDGSCANTTKWYDMEDDMTRLSKLRPDLVFCVNSDGEESPDFQKSWFHDGGAQFSRGEIVFRPLDLPALLAKKIV